MLSRIAESLFWIGRYVERAEDTARILDVQTQLILEDPGVDEETTCRSLLSIMGVGRSTTSDRRSTPPRCCGCWPTTATSTASIAATLAAARESARRARETLSTSMWEAMNTTYRAIPSGHFRSMRPPVAFRWVRDRAAQINGIAEATMTRDEGYQFLVLGRSIERADMTSRLVATAALTSGSAWGTSLRACGAYEAFLRTYKGLETERGAAEFLLLDRLFPRSVVFGLSQAERCLEQLAVRGHPRRLPERGAAAARPDPRRAGVPLAERLRRRAAHRDGTPAAHLRAGDRRDHAGATSPAPRQPSGTAGDASDEHAAADRPHHRLRVRRQGQHVLQRGPPDAADAARARSSCTRASRSPRRRGPTPTATTGAPR